MSKFIIVLLYIVVMIEFAKTPLFHFQFCRKPAVIVPRKIKMLDLVTIPLNGDIVLCALMEKANPNTLLLSPPCKYRLDKCCSLKITTRKLFGNEHVMPFFGVELVPENYTWCSLGMQEIRSSAFACRFATVNYGHGKSTVKFWVIYIAGNLENTKTTRAIIGSDIAAKIGPYLRMEKNHLVVPGCEKMKNNDSAVPRDVKYVGDHLPFAFNSVHELGDDGVVSKAPWCAYLKVSEALWMLHVTTEFTKDKKGNILGPEALYENDNVILYLFGEDGRRAGLNAKMKINDSYPRFKVLVNTRTP